MYIRRYDTYHFVFESRNAARTGIDGFARIVAERPDEPGPVLAYCSYDGNVDVRSFLLDKADRHLASGATEYVESCPIIDVYGLDTVPM